MIYFTGDVHCPIDAEKLNTANWPEQKKLNREDYLIVCGDMGIVWDGSGQDRWWQNWFENKPFTTLFVDGNHENHAMLDAMPVLMWKGGKVHQIRPHVLHLMRGQVFDLNGTTLFAMGGASSHDRIYRKEGISWWPRELPDVSEYEEAVKNLEEHHWKTDLVATHCAPASMQEALVRGGIQDSLTRFLEDVVLAKLVCQQWYFGHYHKDEDIDSRHHGIYQSIICYQPEGQKNN